MTWMAAGTVAPACPHPAAACLPAVRNLGPVAAGDRGCSLQAAGLLEMQGQAQRAGLGSINPGRDVLCHLI